MTSGQAPALAGRVVAVLAAVCVPPMSGCNSEKPSLGAVWSPDDGSGVKTVNHGGNLAAPIAFAAAEPGDSCAWQPASRPWRSAVRSSPAETRLTQSPRSPRRLARGGEPVTGTGGAAGHPCAFARRASSPRPDCPVSPTRLIRE